MCTGNRYVVGSAAWDPQRSSLFQVLVSVQSQILVPNPIVNEPGYDSREGSAQSTEYSEAGWDSILCEGGSRARGDPVRGGIPCEGGSRAMGDPA